jgi:hypothetical protein
LTVRAREVLTAKAPQRAPGAPVICTYPERRHARRYRFGARRVARVRIFVNGRLERDVRLAPLQKRALPRFELAQGRNRVRVRVTFQLGSGSRPVSLKRVLRVCRFLAARPTFTG